MHHFFVTPSQVAENVICVEGADVNHMKNVLRIRAGEQVEISDGNNRTYRCSLTGYEEGRAVLAILERREADTELGCDLFLFQGLPKGDKMDLIVQKAVELGACRVIPVAMRRSVVQLDEKRAAKKVERWNGIARSAAEQAGRSRIPEVGAVVPYQEALRLAQELDVVLLPYELARGMEETRKIIRGIRKGQSVGIFIGPEGGFAAEEVERALAMGARPITLGRRILRTETAGFTALAILMFELEDDAAAAGA